MYELEPIFTLVAYWTVSDLSVGVPFEYAWSNGRNQSPST